MKTWDRRFRLFLILFIILIVIILFLPYAITQWKWVSFSFSDNSRLIGSTLGGILGPFVAIVASGLTFIAFWVQYKANQQQREDIQLERFENKFYEMLRLHKENVSEIDIGGVTSGRKAIVRMYQEFRFIYLTIMFERRWWNRLARAGFINQPEVNASDEEITDLAYSILFFGVGDMIEGSIIYHHRVHTPFLFRCLRILKRNQHKYSKLFTHYESSIKEPRPYYEIGHRSMKKVKLECHYYPFDGHASKLGHYYRHLYQTMKFIVTSSLLSYEQKYDYVKMIRAQLSNHEQAMIYYNSFFKAGWIWWQDNSISDKEKKKEKEKDSDKLPLSYFIDYKMIKNIPWNLTKGIRPDPYEYFIKKMRQRYDEANLEYQEESILEWAKSSFEWKED